VKNRIKARAIYWVTVYISVMWALAVMYRTASWEPWQAWGLAAIGVAFIAFIGLRLMTILDTRWHVRECNRISASIRRPVGEDPREWMQRGHRVPYESHKVVCIR
jgi:hypothetical protein